MDTALGSNLQTFPEMCSQAHPEVCFHLGSEAREVGHEDEPSWIIGRIPEGRMGLRAVAVTAGPSPSYLNPVSELEPLSVDKEASWGTLWYRGRWSNASLSGRALLTERVSPGEEGAPGLGKRACRQGLETQSVEPCHFPSQDGTSAPHSIPQEEQG